MRLCTKRGGQLSNYGRHSGLDRRGRNSVTALGEGAVERIFRAIATDSDFGRAKGPYGDGDFGAFEAEGATLSFKIDYYDLGQSMPARGAAHNPQFSELKSLPVELPKP